MVQSSFEERRRKWLTVLLGGGATLAALLILAAPPLPQWGERHTPHTHKPPFPLSPGHRLEQTFRAEGTTLDAVVLWIATDAPTTQDASLLVEVESGERRDARVSLANVPPSGTAVLPLHPPLRVGYGADGIIRVTLVESSESLGIRYQIASDIYKDGRLTLDGRERQGDLAFQLRYQRPALGTLPRQWGMALALFVAGMTAALVVRVRPRAPVGTSGTPPRRDVLLAGAIGIAIAGFYGFFLLPRGLWTGPTDFSKDAIYLSTAAAAVRNGAWPAWSHSTCGGMAALGNPEGNTISLGTLLALVFPPDRALLALLVAEAGIGAAGAFALARALGISRIATATVSAVSLLSGAFAYRIVEGLTPVGGAVAFLPWALFFLHRAIRRRSGPDAIFSGTALAAIFLRGDVHVIVGIAIVLAVWCAIAAFQTRSGWPGILLAGIGATAFLWGSIKILPYLTQPSLIGGELQPYVLPLVRTGTLNDAWFRTHDRTLRLKPLHDRREETWGNFGAAIGMLPLVLGSIGILTRHPARAVLLTGGLTAFLLTEGALFEDVLRHVGPLAILLRVPTRLWSIVVLFVGLFAGIAIDRMRQDVPQRARIALPVMLLLLTATELALSTAKIFHANLSWASIPLPTTVQAPTLRPHAHVADRPQEHPTALLRAGFLLPKICGDQNNPPPFVKELKTELPLASVPGTLKPNTVILNVRQGPADIAIRERFVSSWTPSHGAVLEGTDGGIHLVLPAQESQKVSLRFVDPLSRAEIVVFLLLLLTLGLLSASAIHFRGRERPTHP